MKLSLFDELGFHFYVMIPIYLYDKVIIQQVYSLKSKIYKQLLFFVLLAYR